MDIEPIGNRVAVIDRQRGMVIEYSATFAAAVKTGRAYLTREGRCIDVLLIAPTQAGSELTVLHRTASGQIVTRTGY